LDRLAARVPPRRKHRHRVDWVFAPTASSPRERSWKPAAAHASPGFESHPVRLLGMAVSCGSAATSSSGVPRRPRGSKGPSKQLPCQWWVSNRGEPLPRRWERCQRPLGRSLTPRRGKNPDRRAGLHGCRAASCSRTTRTAVSLARRQSAESPSWSTAGSERPRDGRGHRRAKTPAHPPHDKAAVSGTLRAIVNGAFIAVCYVRDRQGRSRSGRTGAADRNHLRQPDLQHVEEELWADRQYLYPDPVL